MLSRQERKAWEPSPIRRARRKLALHRRRVSKKERRKQSRRLRRLCDAYGHWIAWFLSSQRVAQIFRMLLRITFYSIVSLTWACLAIVIMTFLRLVVAAVMYTIICFIVASILWFLFVLLTETWHGVDGRCDSDILVFFFVFLWTLFS